MKKILMFLMLSVVLLNGLAFSQEKKDEKQNQDNFLKIGDIGFLKMGQDKDKGILKVELFQVDKKAALVIEGDLKLNATVGSDKKEFVLKAKDGKYEISDEFLKKEISGRFVFNSNGKEHIVKVGKEDSHGHGHHH